jgi:hypothetical protein
MRKFLSNLDCDCWSFSSSPKKNRICSSFQDLDDFSLSTQLIPRESKGHGKLVLFDPLSQLSSEWQQGSGQTSQEAY